MLYRVLADILLLVHAMFVAFVVLGQVLILVGLWRGWRWVRGFTFRTLHLAAIGFVVAESWLGIDCPLTGWEDQLREAAGQATYQGDFIAYWIGQVLYYDVPRWVFTVAYTTFGLLVVASFILAPPRLPPRRRNPHRAPRPAR